jgi:SAM-dependent methyltransferase
MQARQMDRKFYFDEQSYTTTNYVIPYLESIIPLKPGLRVLEIGCGEGGNLLPFLERQCHVVGVDLSEFKIKKALNFLDKHPLRYNLKLIWKDIFALSEDSSLQFDLIFLRDTLEHIPNQELFLEHIKKFLAPNGKVFIAFPAWRMPFGGHQQMCKSKVLCKIPYLHLLPHGLYGRVLSLWGEPEGLIKSLLEIKHTRISLQQFKQIVNRNKYVIVKHTYYLINPNYEVKFGLKQRKLPKFINIPHLRDFFVTTMYCIIADYKHSDA